MKDLKIPLFIAPTEVIVMRRSYPMIFSLVAAIVSMSPAAYAQDTRIASKRAGRNFPMAGSGDPHPGSTSIARATFGFSRDVASAQMIYSWRLAQTGDP